MGTSETQVLDDTGSVHESRMVLEPYLWAESHGPSKWGLWTEGVQEQAGEQVLLKPFHRSNGERPSAGF